MAFVKHCGKKVRLTNTKTAIQIKTWGSFFVFLKKLFSPTVRENLRLIAGFSLRREILIWSVVVET
jgi:hypothetical protein